ncbi:MAG TPA: flagellar motor switch protein FliG [Firmicutes bacterium]|nr:flagellar motor switch protein FliG [Bacillota bacterium]
MPQKIPGKRKAAILMVALGKDASAEMYKYMTDTEVEDITMELANLGKVDSEVIDMVYKDFYEIGVAHQFITTGGVEYARSILQAALGDDKAEEVVARLSTFLQVSPFDFIRRTDPKAISNFIVNEHPQTIALVMAYLNPEQASTLLQALDPEKQAEVARRLATLDHTSPDVIREIERVMEKNLAAILSQEFSTAGGVSALVEVLNRVDRATEKAILESLADRDPELAEQIKNLMFVFEDIVHLDDRSVQQVLREVDTKELSLALKGVSDEVAQKVFRNMSKRAASMLQEEMEFMGPVRLRDVEAAQQRIVNIIRQLEDQGDIIIARGGEEELIV